MYQCTLQPANSSHHAVECHERWWLLKFVVHIIIQWGSYQTQTSIHRYWEMYKCRQWCWKPTYVPGISPKVLDCSNAMSYVSSAPPTPVGKLKGLRPGEQHVHLKGVKQNDWSSPYLVDTFQFYSKNAVTDCKHTPRHWQAAREEIALIDRIHFHTRTHTHKHMYTYTDTPGHRYTQCGRKYAYFSSNSGITVWPLQKAGDKNGVTYAILAHKWHVMYIHIIHMYVHVLVIPHLRVVSTNIYPIAVVRPSPLVIANQSTVAS